MSAGGPLLNGQPEPADDIVMQVQTGLAETPKGQQVAIMITVLFGKDAAVQIADAIKATAAKMSSSGRLVIATPGNGVNQLAPPGVNPP